MSRQIHRLVFGSILRVCVPYVQTNPQTQTFVLLIYFLYTTTLTINAHHTHTTDIVRKHTTCPKQSHQHNLIDILFSCVCFFRTVCDVIHVVLFNSWFKEVWMLYGDQIIKSELTLTQPRAILHIVKHREISAIQGVLPYIWLNRHFHMAKKYKLI